MSYHTIALRPTEQLVEFRFVCKLNAKTAEARAKELLGQLRSALLTDSAFADNSYNLYAVLRPSEVDREWGAVDKFVIGD